MFSPDRRGVVVAEGKVGVILEFSILKQIPSGEKTTQRFENILMESQGQNLALAVQHVACSPDSALGFSI